jgi:hypothetical protein
MNTSPRRSQAPARLIVTSFRDFATNQQPSCNPSTPALGYRKALGEVGG